MTLKKWTGGRLKVFIVNFSLSALVVFAFAAPVWPDESLASLPAGLEESVDCEECQADGFQSLSEQEKYFFKDCPKRQPPEIDNPDSYWDAHSLFYSISGITQIEVLRAADWVVDLGLPGRSRRPFYSTVRAIRGGYAKLPRWLVVRRIGEFVDAFQIPELSFGDASSAYTVASGGTAGIGGGTLYRVNLLIDWTQHVVGDINRGSGSLVGLDSGLLPGGPLEGAVDGVQWVFTKVLNQVSVVVSRSIEGLIEVGEDTVSYVIHKATRTPHHETTVFLRLPVEVYRAYELWVLEHQNRIFIGEEGALVGRTHAELMHDGLHLDNYLHDRLMVRDGDYIVMMTDRRTFSSAPRDLQAYVVPAAWVLHHHEDSRTLKRE